MTAKSPKIQEEEDEEMVLEEEEDHGAQSMDLDDEVEKKKLHICSVCGKGFNSGKGLGGHKRIHKIEDDDVDEFMISSDDNDDDSEDEYNDPDYEYEYKFDNDKNSKKRVRTRSVCINDLIPNGWCTKRKRSLRVHTSNLKNNPSSSLSQDMMMDIEESNNLMILASAAEAVAEEKKRKRLCKLKKQSPSFSSSSSSTCTQEQKLKDQGDEARDNHVCVTCNKLCTSYQSLGGHVTSHHRVKKLEATNDQVRAKFEPIEKLLGLACTQKSAITPNPAQAATTTARAATPVAEVKIGQERMVLDFDLNKLPPEAEEEERV